MIHFGDTLFGQAHTDFGAKFNGFIEFATHDRSHMRLVNTHDPVIATVRFMTIHLVLLAVNVLNHPVLL